ncbi:NAD(P)-binding protein [Punctularia strigosozonata HHB-11173 SS5]|uniref:NAD(P)-binding protein n=1 Tax=Punctularia strigosozonata (strain HHB-11173) TaxID=741275 RepID=R7S3P1_PUNST|nr:NAD(P)-binding protein [Punctularia strigosozonata HHB-11173 SS5]EIN04479.1 NAD(P)-binding protein [Punctularia strigosozonata HHB-11173 SS5]
MSLLVLTAADVSRVIRNIGHDELTAMMGKVFADLSANRGIVAPHRTSVPTARHNALFMPSRLGDCTAMKVVSVPTSSNDSRGLPASTIVLDEDTGAVRAILNAASLTAIRTAAGSLLATKLVFRESTKPFRLAAFGAGKQIEAHVTLHLQAYPSIYAVDIFSRTVNSRVTDLISLLQSHHPSVSFQAFSSSDKEAMRRVRCSNIICCATSSTQPLITWADVSPSTHINLVGAYTPAMVEADESVVKRAGKIIVDSRDACGIEAGDLLQAGLVASDVVEIGALVSSGDNIQHSGIGGSDGVTIFKSVGVGVQDVAISKLVVERAEEMGLGTGIGSYNT